MIEPITAVCAGLALHLYLGRRARHLERLQADQRKSLSPWMLLDKVK